MSLVASVAQAMERARLNEAVQANLADGAAHLAAVRALTGWGDLDEVRAACERAAQHCPSSAQLWVEHLHCLERQGAAFSAICELFQRCITCTFTTVGDYRLVFSEFLGCCGRAGAASLPDLHEAFETALHYFTYYNDEAALVAVAEQAIATEEKCGGDANAVRALFERLVKRAPGNAGAWQAWARWELRTAGVDAARAVFVRAVGAVPAAEALPELLQAFGAFERLHGSLETIDAALLLVEARREALTKPAAAPTCAEGPPQPAPSAADDEPAPQKGRAAQQAKPRAKAAKADAAAAPAGRRGAAGAQDKPRPKAGKQRQAKAPSPEPEDEEDDSDAPAAKRQKREPPPKVAPGSEDRTAFVWNIPFTADEAAITEFLAGCEIQEVRLMRNKLGRSKGFAYVQLADHKELVKAFGFDKKRLQGRQVRVQQANEGKTPKELRELGEHAAGLAPAAEGADAAADAVPAAAAAVPEGAADAAPAEEGAAPAIGPPERPPQRVNPYLTAPAERPRPVSFLTRHKRGGIIGVPRAMLAHRRKNEKADAAPAPAAEPAPAADPVPAVIGPAEPPGAQPTGA